MRKVVTGRIGNYTIPEEHEVAGWDMTHKEANIASEYVASIIKMNGKAKHRGVRVVPQDRRSQSAGAPIWAVIVVKHES